MRENGTVYLELVETKIFDFDVTSAHIGVTSIWVV